MHSLVRLLSSVLCRLNTFTLRSLYPREMSHQCLVDRKVWVPEATRMSWRRENSPLCRELNSGLFFPKRGHLLTITSFIKLLKAWAELNCLRLRSSDSPSLNGSEFSTVINCGEVLDNPKWYQIRPFLTFFIDGPRSRCYGRTAALKAYRATPWGRWWRWWFFSAFPF
jgi:hypothetical protein